jgi:aminopeptidase YwaD
MLNKFAFIIALIFVGHFSFAQKEKAAEITEILCSDSLFGRGYVKDGVNKAADYIASEFEKSGLEPYFKDSYFQAFKFNVNTFPGKMSVVLNGKELTPGKDFIVHEVSGSYSGKLDFAKTLDSTVLEEQDQLTAVLDEVDSGKANSFFVDARGTTPKKEAELSRNLILLAKKAPLVITTGQKFTWSVGRQKLNHPVIILKEELVTEDMKLEVDIEAKFVQNFESKNVVGYLPSSNKKAKTVVFTAHYDHLGGMGTEAYFPGANDNASGTAMLISMADYFKENPVDYNLMFIAFAGEEAGLLGSEHFVNEKSMKLKDIEFLLNLDIMGSGEKGITVVNGKQLTKPFEKLQEINDEKNYLTKVKSRGETQNSDHYHFYKEGVPSFFIYTMGHNQHYHDVYDTHEELSFAAYDNIVKLLVDFVESM